MHPQNNTQTSAGELSIFGYRDSLTIQRRVPVDPASKNGDCTPVESLHLNERQTHELAAMINAIISSRSSA